MKKDFLIVHKLLKFLHEIKDRKKITPSLKNSILVAIFLIEHVGSSNTFITLRELFYILFQRHALSYPRVSYALNNLCKLTLTPREQYQVVSETNLYIYGDLTCSLASDNPFEQTIFTNFMAKEATHVSSAFVLHFDRLKIELNQNVRYLVIIEKHSVLDRLSQFLNCSGTSESIKAKKEMIFCTGKGFASLFCRKFLSLFLGEYKHIKPFILSDADPHGFMIYLNYKFGNIKQCEQETYIIDDLKWLGLNCQDSIIKCADLLKSNLKESEVRLCCSILKRKELSYEEKIHLLMLLKINKKIEIEVFLFKVYIRCLSKWRRVVSRIYYS